MGEILGLRREAPTAEGGSPECIELLEEVLASAKRGEVIAVGMIIINPALDIGTVSRNPGGDRHLLVAGCEYLKADLVKMQGEDHHR